MNLSKLWTTSTNDFDRKQAITMRTPSYSDVREHVQITFSTEIDSLRHAGCFHRVPLGTEKNGWMANLTGRKSGEGGWVDPNFCLWPKRIQRKQRGELSTTGFISGAFTVCSYMRNNSISGQWVRLLVLSLAVFVHSAVPSWLFLSSEP